MTSMTDGVSLGVPIQPHIAALHTAVDAFQTASTTEEKTALTGRIQTILTEAKQHLSQLASGEAADLQHRLQHKTFQRDVSRALQSLPVDVRAFVDSEHSFPDEVDSVSSSSDDDIYSVSSSSDSSDYEGYDSSDDDMSPEDRLHHEEQEISSWIEGLNSSDGRIPRQIYQTISTTLQVYSRFIDKLKTKDYGTNFPDTRNAIQRFSEFKTKMQNLRQELDRIPSSRKLTRFKNQLQKKIKECEMHQNRLVTTLIKRTHNILDISPEKYKHFDGSQIDHELRIMREDIGHFLQSHPDLDPEMRAYFLSQQQKLQDTLSTWDFLSWSGPKELLSQCDMIATQIDQLQPGESALLPGWSKGHAVMYEILCVQNVVTGEINHVFTIINTGEDEDWKMLRSAGTDASGRRLYQDKSYLVRKDMLNQAFFLSLRSTWDLLPTQDMLRGIDIMLLSRNGVPVDGVFRSAHADQQRGNCASQSTGSWLEGDLIRQYGKAKGDAAYRLFTAHRAESMRSALAGLESEDLVPALAIAFQCDPSEALSQFHAMQTTIASKIESLNPREAELQLQSPSQGQTRFERYMDGTPHHFTTTA